MAKPKTRPPLEAEITAQVVQAARMIGLKLERQNTGVGQFDGRPVRFGEEGDPDWRGTLPGGRRLGLEIKRPGERPTPEQMAKLRALNEDGAVGIWIDDAARFLEFFPHVMAGGTVRIDEAGDCWVRWDETKGEVA